MITTDEDEGVPLHTNSNGHLTEHTMDSGQYGSNGILEDFEQSASKL